MFEVAALLFFAPLREMLVTNMTPTTDWHRDDYLISTDRTLLDVALIHDYLSNSTYWATGRTIEVVQRSIDNSLCFGLYTTNSEGKQLHHSVEARAQ